MPAYRTRDTRSRALEVTTDAPQPPSVAIISPTPRVFTFPIDCSPSTSPSTSPFEPENNSFNVHSPSSTTSRAFSPAESVSSNNSIPSATQTSYSYSSEHARKPSTKSKSADASLEPRRPKRGDEDYIKRPENAFILFRRKCCEKRKELLEQEEDDNSVPAPRARQADLSKTISHQWRTLAPSERLYWEELAKQRKKEHEKMYPNYVYRPQRTKGKKSGSKSKKQEANDDQSHTDSEGLPFTLTAPGARSHTRSLSAPTPAPAYQSMQLPSLFMPSCRSSPSPMPMISRRPPRPSYLHVSTTTYDFAHDDAYSTPSASHSTGMESGATNNFFNFVPHETMQSGELPAYDEAYIQPLSLSQHESYSFFPAIPEANQVISPVETTASASSGPPSPSRSPWTPQSAIAALPITNGHESVRGQPWVHHASQDVAYPGVGPMWSNEGEMMWSPDLDVCGNNFDGLSAMPDLDIQLAGFDEHAFGFGGTSASASSSGPILGDTIAPQYLHRHHENHENYDPEQQFTNTFTFNGMMDNTSNGVDRI